MDTLVTLAGIPIGNHLARTQKGQTILVRPFNVAMNQDYDLLQKGNLSLMKNQSGYTNFSNLNPDSKLVNLILLLPLVLYLKQVMYPPFFLEQIQVVYVPGSQIQTSYHMTWNSHFFNLHSFGRKQKVKIADCSFSTIAGKGKVKLSPL